MSFGRSLAFGIFRRRVRRTREVLLRMVEVWDSSSLVYRYSDWLDQPAVDDPPAIESSPPGSSSCEGTEFIPGTTVETLFNWRAQRSLTIIWYNVNNYVSVVRNGWAHLQLYRKPLLVHEPVYLLLQDQLEALQKQFKASSSAENCTVSWETTL